jgi:hypothetical protein
MLKEEGLDYSNLYHDVCPEELTEITEETEFKPQDSLTGSTSVKTSTVPFYSSLSVWWLNTEL